MKVLGKIIIAAGLLSSFIPYGEWNGFNGPVNDAFSILLISISLTFIGIVMILIDRYLKNENSNK